MQKFFIKLKNPYLLFAPFLVFYIILVLIFPTDGMAGDEGRYLLYARFLFNGTLPNTDIDFNTLGNGPGYSILLIPFVALHIPYIYITLLNAFFNYFSIIFLYKSLIKISSFRTTLLLSIFWACYFNSYENIVLILPEIFTSFLISVLLYAMIEVYKGKEGTRLKIYIVFTGILMGYIALTKPIFGYVLLLMAIGNALLWLIKRKAGNYKRGIAITVIALATTVPYLIHTYNLTGKLFYWSSFGGNNLYWMSTPNEGEYGDWFADPRPLDDTVVYNHFSKIALTNYSMKNQHINNVNYYIAQNHEKDFETLKHLSGLRLDEEFTKISINNIKSHPFKYIENCICNAARMLFNFPYSYKLQNPGTLLRLPYNGIIFLLGLFCLIPTILNWKKLLYPVRYLLLFCALYLGGSIFASAETRMFSIIVPILLFWIGYIMTLTVKIKLKM